MLFRKAHWDGLADGSITVAFRYQKKPTVKAGGTLQSKAGLLGIDSVTAISPSAIDPDSARRAGYPSAAAAVRESTGSTWMSWKCSRFWKTRPGAPQPSRTGVPPRARTAPYCCRPL